MDTEVQDTTDDVRENEALESGAEPAEPQQSILEEFRQARKSEREGESEDESLPQADGDATESKAVVAAEEEPVAQEHQVVDPDTGEVLDRRTRSAKRIDALLKERYELRQRLLNDKTPTEAAPQEAPPEHVETREPADDPAPRIEEFANEVDPYAAFLAANSRWESRREYQKQYEAQQAAERTAHAQQQIQQAQQDWDGKLDEVRKRYPQFDQAYSTMYETLPTDGKQRPLVEILLTSPIGHDIVNYLGSNPKVIHDLYDQPTLKAHLRAIGKLEAHVEAGLGSDTPHVSTPVATPPPPMNPVGGGTTPTSYNSQTASLAQFRKRHGVRGGRRNV